MSYKTETIKTTEANNRDPITDAPGAHPIGTGIGAAIGGAAAAVGTGAAIGAATGTVVGPVGTIIGAAIGAVVGGLAGKGVAEAVDPTVEETYWRENYTNRPYAKSASFDDYGPAYQYGVHSYSKYEGRNFSDVETDLARDWETSRGNSKLDWNGARVASQDAWDRLSTRSEHSTPGHSNRDAR